MINSTPIWTIGICHEIQTANLRGKISHKRSWSAGLSQTAIAKKIGVHKSTISREINRNMIWWNGPIVHYKPKSTQAYSKNWYKSKLKHIRFTQKIW